MFVNRDLTLTSATKLPSPSSPSSSIQSPYSPTILSYISSPYLSDITSPGSSAYSEKQCYSSRVRLKTRSWLPYGSPIRRLLFKRSLKVAFTLIISLFLMGNHINSRLCTTEWSYLNPKFSITAKDAYQFYNMDESTLNGLDISRSSFPPELDALSYPSTPDNNYLYDPRLIASLYAFKIRKHLNDNSAILQPDFRLPFSWKDWIDLHSRLTPSQEWVRDNKYFHNRLICESFSEQIRRNNLFAHTLKACQNLNYSEILNLPFPNYPHFKITGAEHEKLPAEARVVIGASYVYHEMPAPERVILLNSLPGGNRAFSILTKDMNESCMENLINEFMAFEYIIETPERRKAYREKGISVVSEIKKLHDEVTTFDYEHIVSSDIEIKSDISRIIGRDLGDDKKLAFRRSLSGKELGGKALAPSEFIWNTDKAMNDLEHEVQKQYNNDNKVKIEELLDYRLLKTMQTEKQNINLPKYFHEARNFDKGAHFDWRFYNGVNLTEYERQLSLHKLAKAWLRFATTAGLNTWLAHGSLLGYYFTGMILDWDYDADVQITQASLVKLARNYNQSLISDTTTYGHKESTFLDTGVGTYLLDVSPYFYERLRGNGNNAIDARFIDIETGLYIDITAITSSDTQIELQRPQFDKQRSILFDQNSRKNTDIDDLYHCRNEHFYTHDEISPLIPTLFEGSLAYVPNKFEQILVREYPRFLNRTTHEGYTLRNKLHKWVSNRVCNKSDIEGESCNDSVTKFGYKLTNAYINEHKRGMKQRKENNGFKPLLSLNSDSSLLRVDNVLTSIAMKRLY
ncbi:hypothetical protein CANARDRAFT_29671 [[Candida] arabinofermentans NRRL YB-2248]|uniref:LicD/FKTN/FKRP nucleotidyltransferase domain-containing protein n=1 Tax=[Candida] arabinofermentans NRRL YB-2248 TaxID=983967 RepID=A0A1E4SWS7_9ASCO|nr:hypothetical protein CANARDRAFT_29671 [[Candida] arabinofermentans NRRL YB-2248]